MTDDGHGTRSQRTKVDQILILISLQNEKNGGQALTEALTRQRYESCLRYV